MLFRLALLALAVSQVSAEKCSLKPLGPGKDDTRQILDAISRCGVRGHTTFAPGDYNITEKMTWNLDSATVDLHGFLNFVPDINFWYNSSNTYRVIFIQSQASWFVITGKDFVIDAHGTGGIKGNGQTWWNYFANRIKLDGDGRPVSLTLSHVTRGKIANFKIDSPPFWCNALADSQDVVYQGMTCNATNTNPEFAGRNIVINTDGIDTYRSNNVVLIDWDVTCGDDCLAIKGNSTNIVAKDIMCRGGNGVAFGSLGQYEQFNDIVENVVLENIKTQRLDPSVQPLMKTGVYFKTWTGTVNGTPPTHGGGGGGRVNNVTAKGVFTDQVTIPTYISQTYGFHVPGYIPSKLRLSNLTFIDWSGTSTSGRLVDLECSSVAPCPNMSFKEFDVMPPAGQNATFRCVNVINEQGIPGPCDATQ